MRDDIYTLAEEASRRGMNVALSSNGVLITEDVARALKGAGFYYVGVSIDGRRETHDRFRGRDGAFDDALKGARNSRDVGLKVGLRLTLSRETVRDLPYIFDLAEHEGVGRLYLSHLVFAGRGRRLSSEALTGREAREVVEYIFQKAEDFIERGLDIEVVTGNNDVDGIYLYLRLLKKDPATAERVWMVLERRGGNSTGVAIACVDSFGGLHPDQYWRGYTIGNVKERPFRELWEGDDPLLKALRDRKGLLKGRCRLCRFIDLCMGNYRERAEAFSGDLWGDDPACYLTNEEIGAYGDGREVSYGA